VWAVYAFAKTITTLRNGSVCQSMAGFWGCLSFLRGMGFQPVVFVLDLVRHAELILLSKK
jgi:hypothetical protein